MRRAALLGNPNTKRAQYFTQAAAQAGLPLSVLSWENWREPMEAFALDGSLLKIDPPLWDSCTLKELGSLSESYKNQLGRLAQAAEACNIRFFNHPAAIAALLDKARCKETLRCAGLPVTELLAKTRPAGCRDVFPAAMPGGQDPPVLPILEDAAQLLSLMERTGISQVFIKPVNGSGAAGVSAFRWQKRSGRMALYTCAMEHPQKGLVHTKRLRRFSLTSEILPLLGQLLGMDCVIERWYAKAQYQGYAYDLRAVVQDGQLDYLLARLSQGPITNLQLNNRPLAIEALKLPASVLDAAAGVCLKAMEAYPGLTSAGIDILLEKGSLTPRVIEMNSQGDLIYQDIYQENTIYRRQAEILKRMGGEKNEQPEPRNSGR